MKKVTYLGLALGLVAVTATAAFASNITAIRNGQKNVGGAGIVNSSHDLSGSASALALARVNGGDVQQRICVFCHHPHNAVKASASVTYSPLWNRGVPSGFTPYNNSNTSGGGTTMMGNASSPMHMMNGTPQFGGVSLLCMSCHDGTTAMNAYSEKNDLGATGIALKTNERAVTGGEGALTGSAALSHAGLDMSNHHPVGMIWNDVIAKDTEIAQQSATFKGSTMTIGSVLSQGRMECVTCHDVHNSGNQAGAERFLWVSDDNSNFCLSCHIK